ncbi:MAG: hypothetical protein WBV61_12640 [Rhodanobacteraceae bacterium]
MSRIFFTDRDLGKRFPEILRSVGLVVERHADHFAHDCPDEIWLEHVGRRGWVAITHDGRIRYKPNELAAVMQQRVALLVVIGRAPFPELAQAFVATRNRIFAFLDRHDPPFIAKVYRPSATEIAKDSDTPGSIVLWHPLGGAKSR